jgi:hypothetical protein
MSTCLNSCSSVPFPHPPASSVPQTDLKVPSCSPRNLTSTFRRSSPVPTTPSGKNADRNGRAADRNVHVDPLNFAIAAGTKGQVAPD